MTRAELPYRQSLAYAQVDNAGIAPLIAAALPALRRLHSAPTPQERAILALADETADIAKLLQQAKQWQQRFRHLVVIGAGGSGLSGRALSLLRSGLGFSHRSHALHVLDNADAAAFARLMQSLPLEDTCFLAISKSGGTAETCAYAALILHILKTRKIGELPARFHAISETGDSPLRAMMEAENIAITEHDPDLGGRFSILSEVGLLPAAFMGIDIVALRAGAAATLQHHFRQGEKSPAIMGAALNMLHMVQGRNLHNMLPYCEAMKGLALWWRQCWAESLGKQGKGSTPLVALGPRDQHSQLQLWLDGPDDKLHTLISCARENGERMAGIPAPLDFLNGHTLGELVDAQHRATAETLARRGRPVRLLEIDAPDETALGALIMHFLLEVLLTAALLGVDPFGQPAVEEGKGLVQEYLMG